MADDPVYLDFTTEEKAAFLKTLKEVRWTGAERVRFRERDVTYRSEADLLAAIKDLEAELVPTSRRRLRSSVATTRTGL